MNFPLNHSVKQIKRSRSLGFTLPELLVVIAIISILATAVLAGMASVTAQAKEDRARAQIAKLHALIMDKWTSFESRRVGPFRVYNPTEPIGACPLSYRPNAAQLRLDGVRELMRLELPDRKSDVVLTNAEPITVRNRPALSLSYFRRVPQNPSDWTEQYDDAECLYLIVSRMFVGDSSALEFFNEGEIGDKDGDGMNEIWDAWENPVHFVRWPSGFNSPFQSLDRAIRNQDPFDPLLADLRWNNSDPLDDPYYLIPLVFSSGVDGVVDMHDIKEFREENANSPRYGYNATCPPNDPYSLFGTGTRMGVHEDKQGDGDNTLDNITNHLISTL